MGSFRTAYDADQDTPVTIGFTGDAHWAWKPLKRSPLPAVNNPDWCITPVDRFILAELERRGMRPAPPADRRTLLRRVAFDLTGLPPAPREIADFLRKKEIDNLERKL